MSELITVTETAASKIAGLMVEENKTSAGLRVFVQGGGCSGFSYEVDFDEAEQPTDFVLEEDGLKILVDPMSFQYLDGTKIDYIESFKFTGFHFENPNATGTCGCGSSFTI